MAETNEGMSRSPKPKVMLLILDSQVGKSWVPSFITRHETSRTSVAVLILPRASQPCLAESRIGTNLAILRSANLAAPYGGRKPIGGMPCLSLKVVLEDGYLT